MERRVLSGVSGGGGGGSAEVNALAPLSCVVDLHGCRVAAIALPAFRSHHASSRKARALTQLLG